MPRPDTPVVHPDRAGTLTPIATGTMPHTSAITRRAAASDGGGGVADAAFATVATAVPCRLSAAPAGDERPSGGRRAVITDWVIAYALDTDVRTVDRLVIGTRTFEVVAVPSPQSYDVELRVQAREIT